MASFTEQDLNQLKSIGKTPESVRRELEIYSTGIPSVKLIRPCSLDDGIIALSEAEQQECAERFEEAMAGGRAMKFVAASGAPMDVQRPDRLSGARLGYKTMPC